MDINLFMDTLKKLAIATGLTAIAGVAIMRRIKSKRELQQEQETPKEGKKKPQNAVEELGKDFLRYADNFQGLYEPMHKASAGTFSHERMRNVLMEWDIRINNIGNIPISLKSWWSTIWTGNDEISDDELQGRAQRVIQMIFSSGIVRDNRTELVVEADTERFYQHSDDLIWTEGQKLRVESPCWYIQCTPVRIIEKGYCELIN